MSAHPAGFPKPGFREAFHLLHRLFHSVLVYYSVILQSVQTALKCFFSISGLLVKQEGKCQWGRTKQCVCVRVCVHSTAACWKVSYRDGCADGVTNQSFMAAKAKGPQISMTYNHRGLSLTQAVCCWRRVSWAVPHMSIHSRMCTGEVLRASLSCGGKRAHTRALKVPAWR